MSIRDIIDGKRQWRAHVTRVEALPPDYRVVYQEMQKYLFKVGPVSLTNGNLLSEIVDFFESGAADGKGVMQLIGPDAAAFCDGLIGVTPTYAELYLESIREES
jgi:DNA-binding ferritin-like protein (Dps family)